ncbi:polyhydroxyalkanoate depolymerase, partial [Rhizobium ruizarguesonis]
MLYQAYQFQDDLIAPLRDLARRLQIFSATALWGSGSEMGRHFAAALEMISRFEITHQRPDFAIDSVMIGKRVVPVTVETVLDMPFGTLLHFATDTDAKRPRVLVVAPLSGHFATLLRGTVQTLLRDHDVYITDWANARDVP